MAEEKVIAAAAQASPKGPTSGPGKARAKAPEASNRVDGTNPSIALTVLIAVGLTAAFYALLVYPFGAGDKGGAAHKWYELLAERTWVVHGIILLFFWSQAILFVKYRKLTRQRRALDLDILPERLPKRINAENVDVFRQQVAGLSVRPGTSFLVDRIQRALDHFKARGNVQEAATMVTVQGDLDSAMVQSSYSMLGVLSWAVPILGFIGTVYGIGDAVGGFRLALDAAADLTLIKDALGQVTLGLAVAFDTTLIALVLSLFIVFPARGLQKVEEDLLSEVDDYCVENLLPRLEDGTGQNNQMLNAVKEAVQAALPSKDWVKDAVRAAMAAQEGEFKNWTLHLQKAGAAVSQQVVEGWDNVNQQLKESQQEQLTGIRGLAEEIARERQTFIQQVQQVQETQGKQLTTTAATMNEMTTRVSKEIVGLQEAQVRSFQDVVAKLSGDLRTIQTQSKEQHAADAQALQGMSNAFLQTLREMREQAGATQAGWSKQIAEFGSAVTQKVVEGWESINAQLRESHGQQIKDVQGVLNSVATERREFMEQVKQVQASQLAQAAAATKTMEETAGRIQQQITQLQESQVRSMKESVTAISQDLQSMQKQTGVAQAEAGKHFEQLSATVTQQVMQGWEKIDAKLRERTEAEVRELSGVVKQMEETATRVQRQIAEAQEGQVRGLREAVGGIGGELRSVREQATQQQQADVENLQRMVGSFSESLRALREQATATQRDMAESLKGSGTTVRDELRRMSGELAEAFRSQLQSAEQVRRSAEEGAEKFAANLERMRSAHAEGMKEAAEVLREMARASQQEFSSSQTDSAHKLQEIAAAVAEQGRTAQRDMESTRQALTELVKQMSQQADKTREIAERAAKEQLAELSNTARGLVTSVGEGLRGVQEKAAAADMSRFEQTRELLAELKREREEMQRATADQLGQVAAMGKDLVASLTEGERKLADQLTRMAELMKGGDKLGEMQRTLSSNLEILATADAFKETLSGIDRGLNHLHPVLKDLSERAGIPYNEGSSDGRRSGAVSRIWRRVKGT